ncbi:hypothetical protein FB451DRAFT_1392721 [Mycena latifolia]|nr:hypothetical protein FB451DRAFT_1392721 [Mycena latifolia]
MTSSGDLQGAAEDPSAAGTAFFSAPSAPGTGPAEPPRPASDVAGSNGQWSPAVSHRSAPATPHNSPMRFTSHINTDGHDDACSHSSRSEDRPGIPVHHSTLFGSASDPGEPSTESALSDSTPLESTVDEYPPLALDIDPDLLGPAQFAQLNAIRGHIGTLGTRLAATTAIVAKHQAATEDTQDAIQALRTEVVSCVDSLQNEVNSQRSRLNRCLDDNLRILRDAGTSGSQIHEILRTMGCNGGAHRRDCDAPASLDNPSVAPKAPIPAEMKTVVDAVISPRGENKSQEEFDARAAAILRTKESAHTAFPLPAVNNLGTAPQLAEPKVARFLPTATEYQSVGSASRIMARSDIARQKGNQFLARQMDRDRTKADTSLACLNDSPSAHTIESRVGTRIELPQGVRAPKVSDPPKYRGQDDHDLFTVDFLEKVLAWMRAGTYSRPDLDWYWVVLIQNYLEGEAHRWYVTEVNAYAQENNGDAPMFADIICAMHRCFVKSSTAQRATRAFDAVAWIASAGPEQLYSDLLDKGRRMVHMPDEFVIKRNRILLSERTAKTLGERDAPATAGAKIVSPV